MIRLRLSWHDGHLLDVVLVKHFREGFDRMGLLQEHTWLGEAN